MAKTPPIGIDFGTVSSSVAVFQNGKVEIIKNERGSTTTPSYVAFTDTRRFLGGPAKDQAAVNPTNTIFGVKRLIKRRVKDPDVQADMRHCPFKIGVGHRGMPFIETQFKGKTKNFWPEEISAMILAKMKETAEAHLGRTVTDAVIAIPSTFNYSQRLAIRDAATIAGLRLLRTIPELSAAAMAYSLSRERDGEKNFLFFDLGGGTTNVSVVTIEDHILEVKSTAGNAHLGGEDFDGRLVNHFAKEFRSKYNKDLDRRALYCLKKFCERAKRNLSTSAQTAIEIDSIMDGVDFYTSLTRSKFEEINDDLFRSAIEIVEKALRDATMDKSQIDEVVLVGGSTRIPKVRKLLEDFFSGKKLNASLDPEEAVARGAAIQAAILQGDRSEQLQNLLLLEVTPFSLGIETRNGAMNTIIKRNTTIPTKQTHAVDTYTNNQFEVKVYEGERAMTKDNNLIGQVELTSIPRRGQIEIIFEIDSEDFLSVSIVETTTNTSKKVKMTNANFSRFSKKDIDRMVNEANRYRNEEENSMNAAAAKDNLELYCLSVKNKLEDLKDNMSYSDGMKIVDKCNRLMTWLDVQGQTAEKEEYESKQKELENIYQTVTKQTQQNNFNNLSNRPPTRSSSEKLEADSFAWTPSVFLQKAKCGNCKNYLSYFPIYIAADKLPICGRCTQPTTEESLFIRDTLYESVVAVLKFPCIYDLKGCLANLVPADVPHHEKYCNFRTVPCPMKCAWQDKIHNLFHHFEETHSCALLKNNSQFELNFINSQESCYLVVYKEEIFNFEQKFSQSENVLKCSLHCYKLADPDTKYNYQITIKNAVGTDSLKFPLNPVGEDQEENTTKIAVEDVMKQLNDPAIVIGIINVTTAEDEALPDEPPKKKSEVNYELLAELECPVCFDYITPPIYQCVTGHSICAECKIKIAKCPSCKAEIKDTKNFTLEKMASLLIYPCRFAENGCEFISKHEEIKEHQKYCHQRPRRCPLKDYKNCNWEGFSKDMFNHILNHHHNGMLETNTVDVCVQNSYLNQEDSACYIIKFSDLLFRLHYLYKDRTFYWAMQSLGPPDDAEKYKFEIDVVDNKKKNRKMLLRNLCMPFRDRTFNFDAEEDYVFLALRQIESFFTDRFTYKVRLLD